MNVFGEIDALYEDLDEDNRTALVDLYAAQYYACVQYLRRLIDIDSDFDDMLDLYLEDRYLQEQAERKVTEMLERPDPVTHYIYDAEVYRKRDRTKEAINSETSVAEKQRVFDKAVRYWTQMTQQYADNVNDAATIQAFMDAGIDYVMWHTEEDDRVCDECEPLDRKIFAIDEVPGKPHWGCRCWITVADKIDIANADKDDIIMIAGRAVGAKAKGYKARNPLTDELEDLVEGTPITQPKNHIIAGKGRDNPIRDIDWLMFRYPGDPEESWTKEKGFGFVYDEYGEVRPVELHWYSSKSYDKVEMKIKLQYGGGIYLDD